MREHTKMGGHTKTVGNIPIGLSPDYDRLPLLGPLRTVVCSVCRNAYEDGARLTKDGCRIMAVMCWICREERRLQWIAQRIADVELPRATAKFRRGKPFSWTPGQAGVSDEE